MDKTDKIGQEIEDNGFDGFLLQGNNSSTDLYYLTSFEAPDSFTYLRAQGKDIILVSPLEKGRADEEAEVDEVVSTSRYKKGDNREDQDAKRDILKQFLEDYGVKKLEVLEDFPLGTAEKIRSKGIEIGTVENKVIEARKIKSKQEVEYLRESQKATERAMEKAKSMIEKSDVKVGKLYYEGEVLSSEKVKREIKIFLLDQGYQLPEETIVACGRNSAKPHDTGEGVLEAGEPIIVDIFPRSGEKYFGDMTRTFVKGGAPEELKKMKQAVLEAQEEAFKLLKQGPTVKASEVHGKVCEVLEEHGYRTLRSDPDTDSGFIHSTGHGVGLDLHEAPRIGDKNEDLEPGMVVTLEPGLYIPDIGGIRLEDMILITEDGYENFNEMSKEMRIT